MGNLMDELKTSQSERDARLSVPVDQMGLTGHAVKALGRLDVKTLGDIAQFDPRVVEDAKGISSNTMDLLRSRFRDADIAWGAAMGAPKPVEPITPAPAPACKESTSSLADILDLRPISLAVAKIELELGMQEVFSIQKGLLRPEFLRLLQQNLARHFPRVPLPPSMRLIQPNGAGAYHTIPNHEIQRFKRRMMVLSVVALAAADMGVGEPNEG